jgi:hypothetical protein
MRKVLLAALLLSFTGFTSIAQSLDEILKNHFEVVGKQKWDAVKSIVVEGKSTLGTTESPYMLVAEGDKMRIERSAMGFNLVQLHDGKRAYTTNPMDGSFLELDNSMANMLLQRPDFGTELLDVKDVSKLSLVGTVDLDGAPAYQIKHSEKGKSDRNYFIDAETFIVVKKTEKREFQGRSTELETLYSDFKDVNGIILAHTKETKGQGGPRGGGAEGQEGGQWQRGGGQWQGGAGGGGQGRTMMVQGQGGGGMAGMARMMGMMGGGNGTDVIEKVVFNMIVDPKVFSKESLVK